MKIGMKIEHYMEVNGREFEVIFEVYTTPFRKGDPVSAYHGPTPDEPAEAFVEQIWLKGKKYDLELCQHHRFFELVPEECDLFDMINELEEPDYPW